MRRKRTPEIVWTPQTVEKCGPRTDIIGVYTLPFITHAVVVEALVHSAPRDATCFGAPSEIQETGYDFPQQFFWLNVEGIELLGNSYSWEGPEPSGPSRLAFFLFWCELPFTLDTPGGKVRIRRHTPIPERLLRLIWLDEFG